MNGAEAASAQALEQGRGLVEVQLRHVRRLRGALLAALAFTVALLVVIVPWAVWVFRITGNPTPAQREAVGPVLVSGGLLLGTASGGLTLALLRLQPQVMLLELRRELLRGDQGEENSI